MPDYNPPPSSGSGSSTAIEDNSGTPALADGITQAEMTTLLGVAPGATAYADADAIAAVEGEATLELTGNVGLADGKQIKWGADSYIKTNTAGNDLTILATDDLILTATDAIALQNNGNYTMWLTGTNRVGIGTTAPANMLHLSDADANEPTILIENTGTSTSEPNLMFRRSGSHPSDPTIDIGRIGFEGDNTADENILYAAIVGDAHVATDGDERGRMRFYVMRAGALTETLRIGGYEVSVNESSNDIDFRVEGNNEANLLKVNAGADTVGIGTGTPVATLDVASGQTFRNTRLLTVSLSSGTLTEAAHAGRYLICTGSVTLPSTSSAGEHYAILNTKGSDITIGRNGNNINGAGSDFTLATYKGATCIAIGSNNWIVLG